MNSMHIAMPPSFPMAEFRRFGIACDAILPGALSNEDMLDTHQRRLHADLAWQAVRYRYRLCSECNEEFQILWGASEKCAPGELIYKQERCIYPFFMAGLSVFESFAFCLYFLGQSISPSHFPHVSNPKKIIITGTARAFEAAFPDIELTTQLTALEKRPEFTTLDGNRNILAHRLSGQPSIRASYSHHPERGLTKEWEEKSWDMPGAASSLPFDKEMLQRNLDEITELLVPLVCGAREFAEQHRPTKVRR